jgi:SAM-dependent methyltransferase/O-antigen/teichoic acid export membrane protein
MTETSTEIFRTPPHRADPLSAAQETFGSTGRRNAIKAPLTDQEIIVPSFIPWAAKGGLAILDQALFAGAHFVLNILLARWLPPAEYGAFALAYSVFLLFAALHTALLTEPMMIFGPGKYADHYQKYLGILLRGHWGLMVPAGVLLLGTAFLLGYLYSANVERAFLGLALAAPLILLLWLVRRAFYVRLRPGWACFGGGLYFVVLPVSAFVFHTAGWLSPFTALLLMGGGALLASGFLLVVLQPQWALSVGNASVAMVANEHWQYGRWALPTAAVIWFPLNVYYAVLPAWAGLEGAGALRALMNLANPALHTLIALTMLLQPVLVRHWHQNGRQGLGRTVRRSLILFLSGSALYVSLLWFFRFEIFRFFYAGKYQEYIGWSLLMMGMLPLVASIPVVLSAALRAVERPDWVFWSYLLSTVAAVAIGIPLTASWGVVGSVGGLFLSYAAAGVVLFSYYLGFSRQQEAQGAEESRPGAPQESPSSFRHSQQGKFAYRRSGLPVKAHTRWITPRDMDRSATTQMVDDVFQVLQPLRGEHFKRMLDIGCGFGGLTKLVGEYLEIPELHGIDLDAEALKEAREKGVVTHHLDVRDGPLPFDDGLFGLVVSFGMLDYLPVFDPLLREMLRVTRPGGYALASLPNLASWHNRMFFLLGYQPRDVEVSCERLVGVHPWYRKEDKPTGHIHTVTATAFQELMQHHGFSTLNLKGARPRGRQKGMLLNLVDAVLTMRPTLARRFFYLGVKPDGSDGRPLGPVGPEKSHRAS